MEAATLGSKRILIGGGTGFIGKHLTQHLRKAGHHVTVISRTPKDGGIGWQQIEDKSWRLPQCDAIVNLAGTNLMAPWLWTESAKQDIIHSRVHTTNLLVDAIKEKRFEDGASPSVYVSASAIGIYPAGLPGPKSDEETKETDDSFFAETSILWERAADKVLEASEKVRLVKVRTGLVLHPSDGALPMMLPRLGILAIAGSGEQYYSWIHMDDMVGIYEHAIFNDKVNDVINAVSPNPVTADELADAIDKAQGGSNMKIHTPAFPIQTLLGTDRANLTLLGQRVYPKRTLASEYAFKHPRIHEAMQDLLQSK